MQHFGPNKIETIYEVPTCQHFTDKLNDCFVKVAKLWIAAIMKILWFTNSSYYTVCRNYRERFRGQFLRTECTVARDQHLITGYRNTQGRTGRLSRPVEDYRQKKTTRSVQSFYDNKKLTYCYLLASCLWTLRPTRLSQNGGSIPRWCASFIYMTRRTQSASKVLQNC